MRDGVYTPLGRVIALPEDESHRLSARQHRSWPAKLGVLIGFACVALGMVFFGLFRRGRHAG